MGLWENASKFDLTSGAGPELTAAFVSAMGNVAASVTLVSTDGIAGRYGQTVSAMTSLSADPPSLMVCLYRNTPAAEAVYANGCFAVNVLGTSHHGLSNSFAGRQVNGERYVFDEAWTTLRTGSPVLPDAPAVFDCEVAHVALMATHAVFVGRVKAAFSNETETLTYRARTYGSHSPTEP